MPLSLYHLVWSEAPESTGPGYAATTVLSHPALDSSSLILILYLKRLSSDVILTLLETQAVQRLSDSLNYSLVHSLGGPEHKAHSHPEEAETHPLTENG